MQYCFFYDVHGFVVSLQSKVCKGSACTMLAVVALDPVWAALCWSVCPWITARRARSLSQCGAAHRWPPQW